MFNSRNSEYIASRILLILVIFLSLFHTVNSDVIVRMEVQQGVATDRVDIRLFEEVAPLTVENFLNYVNNTTINGGNYNNSFIHRSVANFVIQGGGFTFDPLLNDGTFSYDMANDLYLGGLQQIPVDPAIQNEFSKSNIRGTMAMAKKPGDANSATSQWFINLVDNSASLDGENGGFTVFGEVLADGMTVIDGMASHSIYDKTDIHPAFGALPLINYLTDPILQENLVRVNMMTELLSISADIDFKAVLINTSIQSVITIKNTGKSSHDVGDISTTDPLDAPFSIISDTCSNTTLVLDAECTLTIQFLPQAESVFNDTFNIELTDLVLSYSFNLAGEGVLTPPSPDITSSHDAVDFGEVQLFNLTTGVPEQIVVVIRNDGNLDLNISSMMPGGADADDFEFFDNCVAVSPVAPGGFCVLPINFKPLTTGEKSANITVISDDPDENPLLLALTGTASIDTDGIPELVEDAAPNNGDGNNDGVLDSIQNDVASFPGINGSYITLLASTGNTISDISVLSNDQLVAPPDAIQFSLGVLEFRIENILPGGTTQVGLILPPGYVPSTYYMYGPTPDNINPHWYEFMFDGATGAEFIGNAAITSPDGSVIERNLVRLFYKDGGRGDADLLENGVVIDPGAPVVSLAESGSGSMSSWSLLTLMAIPILYRRRYLCA